MCRLYALIATEPTKVECSLVRAQNALLTQSHLDSRGMTHPDGWGIAYYMNGLPVVERRSHAAYNDLRFASAAEHVRARIVVAHVRSASVGIPAMTNTHPFSMGRWVFAHNGTIPRFDLIAPRLETSEEGAGMLSHRRGTTDSELVFLWILGRILRGRRLGPEKLDEHVPLETIVRAVRDCANAIEAWCIEANAEESPSLNFVITNGKCLVAARRGNTAYWLTRDDMTSCELCGVCHCARCGGDAERRRHAPISGYRAVVVASEPLTSEPWRSLPDRHVLAVGAGIERADVSPF